MTPILPPSVTTSTAPNRTAGAPERCPHCNAPKSKLVTRGVREKKLETVHLFRCRSCGRTFTPGPSAIRNKTYPVREILAALSTYNLGYSLAATAAKLSSRYGHSINPSTISRWLSQHPTLTSYRRLRDRANKLKPRFTPPQAIRLIKLYHRQVYEFGYHRPKLALLRLGLLDDKRLNTKDTTARFAPLADFLEAVPKICPHHLFRPDDNAPNSPNRGSQVPPDFIDFDKLIVVEKQNAATDIAALIIPTVGSNYDRHPKLQKFMLGNDSTTIAIEIPIWLSDEEITALENEHNVALIPKTYFNTTHAAAVDTNKSPSHIPRTFTGHLDFLQVRNGAVHILDYKPGARTDKPIAQLTLYALALTRRVPGLALFDIKCAWFDEHVYNEFFPRTVLKRVTK